MLAEKRFRFDRNIDVVALTALVLSLFAAVSALSSYWRGPDLKLITPRHVGLYVDRAPGSAAAVVHVAASMAYANVAQEPYGDLVLEESATLNVGGKTTRQEWNAYGKLEGDGLSATAPTLMEPLPGGTALSHITLFAPVPAQCRAGDSKCDPARDSWSPELLAAYSKNAKNLVLEFALKPYKGAEIRKTCTVPLTPEIRGKIANLRQSVLFATCREKD